MSKKWFYTDQDTYIGDKNAILFNLSKCRNFPSKRKTGIELFYSFGTSGPYFTGGKDCELGVKYPPINSFDRTFESRANLSGYAIPLDANNNNMLTN